MASRNVRPRVRPSVVRVRADEPGVRTVVRIGAPEQQLQSVCLISDFIYTRFLRS